MDMSFFFSQTIQHNVRSKEQIKNNKENYSDLSFTVALVFYFQKKRRATYRDTLLKNSIIICGRSAEAVG